MDGVISETDIAVIASVYLDSWEPLRPHLGLSREKETAIRNSFPISYEQQKRECLHEWEQLRGNGATYGALITAAQSANNQLLADKVKALVDGMFMYTSWEGGTWYTCNTHSQRYMYMLQIATPLCVW